VGNDSGKLTIVMYHYVRDLENSRYPGIKGLTVRQFEGQVEYLGKHYTFVTADEVIAALGPDGKRLPNNAVLLTFDDGYLDHFINVYPILNGKGIQGCFYPPAKSIVEREVLDVNKIQFVLAVESNSESIVLDIYSMLDEYRTEFSLDSNGEYHARYAAANRFDSAEIIFIKRLLQKGLPEACRARIADRLFQKYVAVDELAFAAELYMTSDQLRCLQRQGMHIGSHSYDHKWFDTLSAGNQESQVEQSFEFLRGLGCGTDNRSFNYPYGGYDSSTGPILRKNGVKFGVTTKVDLADFAGGDPLLLSRLDTNDLPKDGNAPPNEWTHRVNV